MEANFTSPTGMPAFSNAALATSSGKLPGAETATDFPLRSASEPISLRAKTPCGTTIQLQPMILTSAPRATATMVPPGPPSKESSSPASAALEAERVGLERHEFELEPELLGEVAL